MDIHPDNDLTFHFEFKDGWMGGWRDQSSLCLPRVYLWDDKGELPSGFPAGTGPALASYCCLCVCFPAVMHINKLLRQERDLFFMKGNLKVERG